MLAFLPKVNQTWGARNVIVHEAVSSRLACAMLACGLLLLGAAPSDAQPAVQQVLVLQSFARGNLTLDHFTGNFRVDLDQIAGKPVNVVQFVVGPTGFVGAPEPAVVDYIRSTFAGRPRPDLIVTSAAPRRCSRASIGSSSFQKRRSCLRPSMSDISAARHSARTKPPSRSSTISPGSSTTSCRCCQKPGTCSW